MKCPNSQCDHIMSVEELNLETSPQCMEKINEHLLKYYTTHTKDMRKCPNFSCESLGVLDLKPCGDHVVCHDCKYTWRDQANHTWGDKIGKKISDLTSYDSELLSDLSKVLKGEPCPQCGYVIVKNGGCEHMVCQCGYEFCWICLG